VEKADHKEQDLTIQPYNWCSVECHTVTLIDPTPLRNTEATKTPSKSARKNKQNAWALVPQHKYTYCVNLPSSLQYSCNNV